MNLKHSILYLFLTFPILIGAQTFTRSVLPFPLNNPWEIVYGPDNFLWITEKNGTVSRVNPVTGLKFTVYQAADYFSGDDSEDAPCGLGIGANTYGLALHPDFLHPDHSFLYYIYSYNSGTSGAPATLFKIVKLTWDAASNAVIANEDLVTGLANGYDHFGYRMIAVQQNGNNYLYYSIGDTGSNFDNCYATPADNPNLLAQDPAVMTGKIHRINIDGTIPEDNPITGNSFFTRGHRNPQGLAYNPSADVLYGIEHGHTTDDEINILQAGMNYGWKNVKGYHDGNYPDELAYVQNYTAHPAIANDSLVEPLFSWGAVPETTGEFLTWPTVAPSDGIYYGSTGIPEWTNSLLVVTLKNGSSTDQEVFQFQLKPDGLSLEAYTTENPNPKTFFGEDQALNGRLRDIAISPDGKKIFLITNNNNSLNPIIVYTRAVPTATLEPDLDQFLVIKNYPNPFSDRTIFHCELKDTGRFRLEISNQLGQKVKTLKNEKLPAGHYAIPWEGTNESGRVLANGIYYYTLVFNNMKKSGKIVLSK